MEVADDRNRHAETADLADDLRHCRSRGVRVDGDPNQLRPGMGQAGDLEGRPVRVGGVGVRHRLDDDGVTAAHHDAPNVDGDRAPSSSENGSVHVYGAPPRTMSK